MTSENDNGEQGTTDERFADAVCAFQNDALEVFWTKNRSYGPDNIREIGLTGVASRMRDKLARVLRLSKQVEDGGTATSPDGESLADALVDMSNYAMIGALVLRREWPGMRDVEPGRAITFDSNGAPDRGARHEAPAPVAPRGGPDRLQVRFTGAAPRLFVPQREGDVGFDLAIDEDFTVPTTSRPVYIRTRTHVKLPRGTWARLVGRSSTARKLGLTCIEGTIDEGFTGELLIGVVNHTNGAVQLEAGTRLAQLIVCPSLVPATVVVDALPETARGPQGFGSTGEK